MVKCVQLQGQQCAGNSKQERKTENVAVGDREEGSQHGQLPLREVDHLSGFVDEYESKSNQSIDTALGDSTEKQLENCSHRRYV